MRDRLELERVTAESTMKGLVGALPFIGTAVNELLSDSRGRLKQARINKFAQASTPIWLTLKPAICISIRSKRKISVTFSKRF